MIVRIARRRQVALALTALLAAGAACQAQHQEQPAGAGRPAPSAAGPGGFTLVASGDVLPHSSVIDRARFDAGGQGYDFRPMLSGVRPVVARADLALCHMETVYGANGDDNGYPSFKSPPEIAQALADTGYDGCSTASNHSLDDGAEGIRRTLDALDRAGVRHAGSARAEAEARTATLLHAGAARVAHLAYTYGTNGHPLPAGQPWAVNLIDEGRILADARAAREAGAVAAGALPYAPARTEQAGHASRPWPRRTLLATAICWPSRRGDAAPHSAARRPGGAGRGQQPERGEQGRSRECRRRTGPPEAVPRAGVVPPAWAGGRPERCSLHTGRGRAGPGAADCRLTQTSSKLPPVSANSGHPIRSLISGFVDHAPGLLVTHLTGTSAGLCTGVDGECPTRTRR
ncbi:CapA family protein [Streptomyces glaucescens]|uniref:CapA family protein n=1 Tax=Streptomyces glaucescens TaxID=1907 RepID=UPI0030D71056